MAEDNTNNPYIAGGIVGGLIILAVILIFFKERNKKKRAKIINHIPQGVQLPDDLNMEDLDNVEFYKTPETSTLKEVTGDAIKLLQAKRNVIKESIIRDRKRMIEELKVVKQTQIEVYEMTKTLVSYYKDLKIKEKILKISISGLIEDGRE